MTVSFASTRPAGFRAGDYWVFAARTVDASVERLDRAPPRGIHHHYARLGIWDVAAGTVTDCRNPWPPPQTDGHDCSCTACVTAESHASGQFTIQDAVNQVRETGGTVCLGPGQYTVAEPVRMIGARSVRIRGQGPGTIVAGPGGVFALQDCFAVAIENLAIISLGRETAVSIRTAIGLSLRQLVIAVPGADAKARRSPCKAWWPPPESARTRFSRGSALSRTTLRRSRRRAKTKASRPCSRRHWRSKTMCCSASAKPSR
ncbi:MAG: hypothetical protein ACXWVC_09200 [Rhodoplanes sp.]